MLVANDGGRNNLLTVPDKMSGKVITLPDISYFFIEEYLSDRIRTLFTPIHARLLCMFIFNNGLESFHEASFVLGTSLNIEENNACFSLASSVIFRNVSKAFVFLTRNHETITGYRMIEIVRDKQNEV